MEEVIISLNQHSIMEPKVNTIFLNFELRSYLKYVHRLLIG